MQITKEFVETKANFKSLKYASHYFLVQVRSKSSITDPCIFFQKALPRLITSIWVDDGLHCSKIMAS